MIKRLRFVVLFMIAGLNSAQAIAQEKLLVVIEPIVNVRREPVDAASGNSHDDLQETQVLYNELLFYKGENEQWYQVEAPEQQEFSHHQIWQGYPGWIKKEVARFIENIPEYDSVVTTRIARVYATPRFFSKVLLTVSMGTRFKIDEEVSRYYKVCLPDNRIGWLKKKNLSNAKNIFSTAKLFLGMPYLWGGRSIPLPRLNTVTGGVDCSGLTSLIYRANNICIPRDAQEQWMVAEKISERDLQTGDLIFVSAQDNFAKIVHVMFYIDGERFMEASGTGNVVGIKTFRKKFGVNLGQLVKQDFLIDGQKISFGRI